MSQPSRVLLDTNVWLDAFDGARPRSHAANELIDVCACRGIDLLYAVGTAKDVHYLVEASLKRQVYAAACVANMDEIATAVGADSSDVWLARKYQRIHTDFEDCMVLAAAQRAKADYLVTSDETLLRHAPVAALSVEDFLALMRE